MCCAEALPSRNANGWRFFWSGVSFIITIYMIALSTITWNTCLKQQERHKDVLTFDGKSESRDALFVCVRCLRVLVGHLYPCRLPGRSNPALHTTPFSCAIARDDRTRAAHAQLREGRVAFSRILLATVWKLPVAAVCSLRTTGLSIRLAVRISATGSWSQKERYLALEPAAPPWRATMLYRSFWAIRVHNGGTVRDTRDLRNLLFSLSLFLF